MQVRILDSRPGAAAVVREWDFDAPRITLRELIRQRVTGPSNWCCGSPCWAAGARELPSGLPAFDAAYQVLVLPRQIHQPPVEPALAERILQWPAGTIAPHSVLAWRDLYAFEVQARLPAPPNWATVSYFIALAGDLIARVPPPVKSIAPHTLVDRLIGRFLG